MLYTEHLMQIISQNEGYLNIYSFMQNQQNATKAKPHYFSNASKHPHVTWQRWVLSKGRQEWELGRESVLPLCVFLPETHFLWRNRTFFFVLFFLQGMAPHIERCICTHSHRYLRQLVNRSNIYFLLYISHAAVRFSMGEKRTPFKSGSFLRRLCYTRTHSSHSFMSADVPPRR